MYNVLSLVFPLKLFHGAFERKDKQQVSYQIVKTDILKLTLVSVCHMISEVKLPHYFLLIKVINTDILDTQII